MYSKKAGSGTSAKQASPVKPEVRAEEAKCFIFIIDDHPVVRQGLAQLINQEVDMVVSGAAGDATEALQALAEIKADVVLVDISLKGTSGIELTKSIVEKYPEKSVIIISMYDESLYLERCLKAGARGYVMKQEATEHVVAAIRQVLSGEMYVSEKMRKALVHNLFNKGTPLKGVNSNSLSDRELQVLHLVGKGYSTSRIAQELFVSIKTIDSHYANIKIKLDLKNSHELIRYAVKFSLAE